MAELLRSICLNALVGGIALALALRADAAPPRRSSLSLVSLNSDDANARPGENRANAAAPLPLVPPQDDDSPLRSDPLNQQQPDALPQFLPQDAPPQPFDDEPSQMTPLRALPQESDEGTEVDGADAQASMPAESQFNRFRFFGLRHSATDGRNAGMGVPLVGTSWLNRPYYFGAEIGTIWVTTPPQSNISRDVDTFGGIYGGCDWDYYWGTELAVQRATPELKNETQPHADRGDRLMLWTASMMYYPWGDSCYRPYWRLGIGEMEIDYPLDNGSRRDEDLWAVPIGLGIKYPMRRWLAARAEFADRIGLGNSGVATQHNFTLTFALEWRFGARPRSYWPWHPSRHIW